MFQFVYLSEDKRKHHTFFRKDLINFKCNSLHLICCYLQIVSMFKISLEPLMQTMHITFIS